MITHFLKFADEDECVFEFDQFFDDEDNILVTDTHTYSLDVIGVIYDEEGVPYEGWHVNFLGELPEYLLDYAIDTPVKPYRVFAGEPLTEEGEEIDDGTGD